MLTPARYILHNGSPRPLASLMQTSSALQAWSHPLTSPPFETGSERVGVQFDFGSDR